MKLSCLALFAIATGVLADNLPHLTETAPNATDVKERIAPPQDSHLYEVWFGKGQRIYQCNPEKAGFQHWYNVQTHALLYPTKNRAAPFDVPGTEVGQISAAPLDPEQQMPNPENSIPVLYDYIDGSWIGTNKPLATTTKEEGRKERGDGSHLDDHVSPVVKASTSGYLSHAKHVVRLHSLDGAVPPAEHCTLKGMVVSKPFSAYYMFYTDAEGKKQLDVYEDEWNRMVEEYTPEKLALENKADSA